MLAAINRLASQRGMAIGRGIFFTAFVVVVLLEGGTLSLLWVRTVALTGGVRPDDTFCTLTSGICFHH
jgi:hypothetical protein